MTLEEIKREIAAMPEEQQGQLAAYLVRLRDLRTPGFQEEAAKRLDDHTPGNWLSLG